MKNLENIFRAAVLLVLVAGLIVAAWHISWLHNQAESRYEMQVANGAVVIFDRQQAVVYSGPPATGGAPIAWLTSPLPK